MKLHNRDAQKLFALSKLNINKNEQESLSQDLSSVLSWVGSLQSVNTKHVRPMVHPVPLKVFCNDDLPPENISLDNALKNAPESENNHFLVPRVIDQA
ncbi:Asp-tRNA(Asn)/Glu-tRNA(Gln) amidotransferase subunit GatC [Betaproteobacteria bacterium]|nr:Asp-tRNA(Asn)/Glu-tRNA(Gln) amidotransferase subunit GatC [Betaproteobacteria bacterium]